LIDFLAFLADDKIVEMYEHAAAANPSHLELHAHLFMACVRARDYKKQQQV